MTGSGRLASARCTVLVLSLCSTHQAGSKCTTPSRCSAATQHAVSAVTAYRLCTPAAGRAPGARGRHTGRTPPARPGRACAWWESGSRVRCPRLSAAATVPVRPHSAGGASLIKIFRLGCACRRCPHGAACQSTPGIDCRCEPRTDGPHKSVLKRNTDLDLFLVKLRQRVLRDAGHIHGGGRREDQARGHRPGALGLAVEQRLAHGAGRDGGPGAWQQGQV